MWDFDSGGGSLRSATEGGRGSAGDGGGGAKVCAKNFDMGEGGESVCGTLAERGCTRVNPQIHLCRSLCAQYIAGVLEEMETCSRRVKNRATGRYEGKDHPQPKAIREYCKFMGGKAFSLRF